MRTFIDFDEAPVFAVPRTDGSVCAGVLIEGPQGWGEFSPPVGVPVADAVRWMTAAVEPGTVGWPDVVRGRVPIAVTVDAEDPVRAAQLVVASGCRSAEVVVAGRPDSLAIDVSTVAAVREALGPEGAIRCDARGGWDADTAVQAIESLERAANGLEFVARPCRDMADTARVRAGVDVRLALHAADVSMPAALDVLGEAADVVVLSCGPLGGVRRALRVAERCGLPAVVASTVQTTIGLSGGLALAGALPELPFACRLDDVTLLAGDLVSRSRSLIPEDGRLPVAPMPPAPDATALRRFAVADPGVVARWRGLVSAVLDVM